MRILAVSDVVEQALYEESKRLKIGDVDLIISCGDLDADYLSYISTVYGAPLFYVKGNHDRMLMSSAPIGENLHGRVVTYKRHRFMGFEGSPRYNRGVLQYSEREMEYIVKFTLLKSLFKGKPDVIVTHAPPKGIHEGTDYSHRGFPAFVKLIHKMRPKYLLHGHTHLNYDYNLTRISVIGETTVINVYGHYLLELQ